MDTAILRMAYLGDGISSDFDDYPPETQEPPGDGEVEETPPIPREDLESGEEPGEENE